MHIANSPDAYLIIAGSGKSIKYRRIAKKLGLQNKIIFLGGLRNIQNALAISNIAVVPSFYDPSSRFILEALVADKPVITTRFNGATDLFTNNRHGKIIDSPRDTAGLAEAISYFSDKGNVKRTSENIIMDNLKEKISIQRVARELVSLYNTL
jgi:UDP-glucose:(heptosyl)LPS alpha-1,3-glucosyltransferase